MKNELDELDELMGMNVSKLLEDLIGDTYTHTGATISNIISESTRVAQYNPEVVNKTYIVSFPARIVTVVAIDKGMVTCFDKGYVDKKVG